MGLDPAEAAWVMQNERDNLEIVTEVVRKEGLDVDFWRGELLESESGHRRHWTLEAPVVVTYSRGD